MIYDGLLSFDLPSREGPSVPGPWMERLERLLFEGRGAASHSECELSAGAVLAGCYAALRAAGADSFSVHGDTDELFSLTTVPERMGEEPSAWAELLPPEWTRLPADFRIRARLRAPGIRATVHLRYTPRHRRETGALVGAVRALWEVVPRDDDEVRLRREIEASLPGEREIRALLASIEDAGAALTADVAARVQAAFEACIPHAWGRAVILHGDGFGELLTGFSMEERRALPMLAALAARGGAWAARAADGVEGELRAGVFVPGGDAHEV